MEEIFKELENEGFKIIVGYKEKERKRVMSEAMKKIKKSGDEDKINYVKKLARYYGIFYNISFIINPEISFRRR